MQLGLANQFAGSPALTKICLTRCAASRKIGLAFLVGMAMFAAVEPRHSSIALAMTARASSTRPSR
jgi:hypothetical protein